MAQKNFSSSPQSGETNQTQNWSWWAENHCLKNPINKMFMRLIHLRGILCKIWVRVGHDTSPIWLKLCVWTCLGVLTTKWMFQSSGKFYFGRFDHGQFRSVPKGSQYGGSKDFLSSFRPAHHNLLPKTINKTLKGYLSAYILWQILCWNKTFWSSTSEKFKCTSTLPLRHINLL